MADVTITIDGNTTALVTSAKKAQAALKAMGDGAQQAGDKIEKTGRHTVNHFERSVMHVGRLVIGAHAIVRALEAARSKAEELQKALVSQGTEQGGFALRASRAAVKGGFNQGVVSSFIDQISPASQEERASFVEQLAGSNLNLSKQDFSTALQAVSSGAYTPEGAMEALKKGEKLNVSGELGKQSPAALRELDTRRQLDAARARTRGGENNVAAERIGAANAEASDLANRGQAALRAGAAAFDFTGEGVRAAEQEMKRRAESATRDSGFDRFMKAIGGKKLNYNLGTDQQ